MTYETTSTTSSPGRPADEHGGGGVAEKADVAKEVAGKAAGRAGDVAGEVTEQAKVVVRDAKEHGRRLVDQGRQHLDDEARTRSRQAAGGLRSIADQLGALAQGDEIGAGAVGEYAQQARQQLASLADRLDDGPAAVLDDMRRFARRQPVVFLAAAGALGFVAGRFVRGVRDAPPSSDGPASVARSDRAPGGALPAPLGATTPGSTMPTALVPPVGDVAP